MPAAAPVSAADKLEPVDLCQLTQHPAQWDGKLIRINAQVKADKEELVLEDASREQPASIWLTSGGKREAPEVSSMAFAFPCTKTVLSRTFADGLKADLEALPRNWKAASLQTRGKAASATLACSTYSPLFES